MKQGDVAMVVKRNHPVFGYGDRVELAERDADGWMTKSGWFIANDHIMPFEIKGV